MARRDIVLKNFEQQKDFMDTVVRKNIEKYRKGDMTFTVTDENGKPKKGVKITAVLKNHEFRYGANLFMLDEFENGEKNKIYRERFPDIANIATVPFYWDALEPEQGKPRYTKDSPRIYRRPPIDLCLEYCAEKGIEPKCHCLNYDAFVPDWVKRSDIPTYKFYLEKRMKELAERYASVIPSWEVTNETFYSPKYTMQTSSKFYGADDYVEWSFEKADQYFPNNKLIINDFFIFEGRGMSTNRAPYYMQIERLLKNGITHLDSIGMQFHSFKKYGTEEELAFSRYNPEYLYHILDMYAGLGKKLQITEMTIPAYSDSEEDQDLQAELIEKIYTVFFSHPAMEAIIYWNTVDGYAAFAPLGDMTAGENLYYGGLMQFDMTPKKSFYTIKRLFTEKWHTNETVVTGADGSASIRGFYGKYDVILTDENGKETVTTVDFRKDAGDTQTFIMNGEEK